MITMLAAKELSEFLWERGACASARARFEGMTLREATLAFQNVPEPMRGEWAYWFAKTLEDALFMVNLPLSKSIRFIYKEYQRNLQVIKDGYAEHDDMIENVLKLMLREAPDKRVEAYEFNYQQRRRLMIARGDREAIVRSAFVMAVVDFVLDRLIPWLEANRE